MADIVLPIRTGTITIDTDRCRDCRTFSCVKACSLFGTNILRIEDGKPSPIPSMEEFPRRCNECVTCELYCQEYGKGALRITLPIEGLSEVVSSAGIAGAQ